MNHEPALRSLQKFKKDIKKEINALKKNQSLKKFVSKFNVKRKSLEKKVKKAVQVEIKQANKFLENRIKELDDFQKKVNAMVKRKIKNKRK